MIVYSKFIIRLIVIFFVFSIFLAGASIVWASSASSPVSASCPCLPGTTCCVTHTLCGWCHSKVCPGGIGVLYNGMLEICYDSRCNQTSVKAGCQYLPCGIGKCQ